MVSNDSGHYTTSLLKGECSKHEDITSSSHLDGLADGTHDRNGG